MLIELWLDQPFWLLVALLVGFFLVTGAAVHALAFSRWTRRAVAGLGVVAPFFGAVSLLFGLLTGFLASDALERNRLAGRAVLAERDALVAMHELSIATVSDMAGVRAAIRAYATSVVADEWPRMADGEAAPQTAAALAALLRELADPRASAGSGLVAHSALLDVGLRVVTARGDRLNLAAQYSDQGKWWTVILLAVLTQLSIALVHADKPRAGAVTVAIFSAAAILALTLVATRERPFDGALGLKPTALQAALNAMAVPRPPTP